MKPTSEPQRMRKTLSAVPQESSQRACRIEGSSGLAAAIHWNSSRAITSLPGPCQRSTTSWSASCQPAIACVASSGSPSAPAAAVRNSRSCMGAGACLPRKYSPVRSVRNFLISSVLPIRRRP